MELAIAATERVCNILKIDLEPADASAAVSRTKEKSSFFTEDFEKLLGRLRDKFHQTMS